MIIFPKETALIQNLNSYYLNLDRLFEHFQGELGCGGIHFRSPTAEGCVFFDENQLQGRIYQDRNGTVYGPSAVDRLRESANKGNFNVAIYRLAREEVYYWSTVHNAEVIYKDLSTEFTDLEGLIKKMSAEKLSGYIDVSIAEGPENGRMFLNSGRVIGVTCSWDGQVLDSSKKGVEKLILKSRQAGGVLNVGRIAPSRSQTSSAAPETAAVVSPPASASRSSAESSGRPREIELVETLLVIFERTFQERRRSKTDFDTLLKKKFVQKAERFEFLDPFADEFRFVEGKVSFDGKVSPGVLAQGIVTSVSELAEELGLSKAMALVLAPWKERYASELEQSGLAKLV